MTTVFPGALDVETRPTGSDSFLTGATAGPTVIDDLADAVEAIEASIGITGTAVTTALRYLVNHGVIAADWRQTGKVTATLGSDQNDYNPASIATSSELRLTASVANVNITGLQDAGTPVDGRLMLICNASTTNTITLKNQSASSTAAYRFLFNNDLVLGPKQTALLRYDSVAARWEALFAPAIGGTVYFKGDLQVPTPANSLSAATRQYVDDEIAGLPVAFDPAQTPAFLQYSAGWPARTVATSSSTRCVIWKGPAATPPVIGGAGNAIDGVDVFWGES